MKNQYLSDRISNIAAALGQPTNMRVVDGYGNLLGKSGHEISKQIVNSVWSLSATFSTQGWCYRDSFARDFDILTTNMQKLDQSVDQIAIITDNLVDIKTGLQDQTINLDHLKNDITSIRDAFVACDANFCLFNQHSPETADQLTWHFNEAIRVIDENDLQYMMDSYPTQTDQIA